MAHIVNPSISSPCYIATYHPAHTALSMQKIRDAGQKSNMFEVIIKQAWQGNRIAQVPVKESQPSPLPTCSAWLSKKQVWSPGVLEANYNYYVPTDQIPKCSRTDGKVCYEHSSRSILNRIVVLRLRMSSLTNISKVELILSLLSCSNCQQDSRTYWCQDCFGPHFSAVPDVFPPMQLAHSITFKCGMGNFWVVRTSHMWSDIKPLPLSRWLSICSIPYRSLKGVWLGCVQWHQWLHSQRLDRPVVKMVSGNPRLICKIALVYT
jgi:hypothetical protein